MIDSLTDQTSGSIGIRVTETLSKPYPNWPTEDKTKGSMTSPRSILDATLSLVNFTRPHLVHLFHHAGWYLLTTNSSSLQIEYWSGLRCICQCHYWWCFLCLIVYTSFGTSKDELAAVEVKTSSELCLFVRPPWRDYWTPKSMTTRSCNRPISEAD